MNPDIWLTAVSRFYDLSDEGGVVYAMVAWTTPSGDFHNASGQVTKYKATERRPDGSEPTVGIGLSGLLDQYVSADPTHFHPMELDIEKKVAVPPTNAVLTVTDTMTRRTLATADAWVSAVRMPAPSIATQINAWQLVEDQGETVVVLLTADADLSGTFVSRSVIRKVLGDLQGS